MSFALQTTITRYIDKKYRRSRGVLSVEAFMDEPRKPLSVNSLGVESKRDVAKYYANTFEDENSRSVGMCLATLSKYNKAAEMANTDVWFDDLTREWVYRPSGNDNQSAYTMTPRPLSPSHAHVQYVRKFDEIRAKNFARAMAKAGYSTVRI